MIYAVHSAAQQVIIESNYRKQFIHKNHHWKLIQKENCSKSLQKTMCIMKECFQNSSLFDQNTLLQGCFSALFEERSFGDGRPPDYMFNCLGAILYLLL